MRIVQYIILFALCTLPAQAEERFLDIQEVKSKSGITAWLVEDHSLPIIAMNFTFKGAGSINDPADKQGRSRLLSNMLDEGAGDLDSQSFQKELSDNSITLGFSSNRDHFSGHIKTLTRYQDKAFNLLKLALTQPKFDQEPLERMKQANISRIRSSLSNPNWIAARIQNDLIYNNHPYALNSGGTISSLEALTTDDLKEFKNTYLTKDKLVIGVMGDITKEDLATQIDNIFSSLPDAPNQQKKSLEHEHKNGIYLHAKEIPQTVINVALPTISRKDPDYYAAQIFNYVFGGGGFGSRLTEITREQEGLTYGIHSSYSFLDDAQKLYISTSTNNETTSRMLEIINLEIQNIKENGITDKELKNAKDYIIGSLPLSLTSTNKISALITRLQQNDRPTDYLDKYSDNINKVTKDDVLRIAQRILKQEKINTVLVGTPTDLKDTIELKELPNVQ